jgi:outer membrane protein insertion porin family
MAIDEDEDRIARKLRREYESALVHLSNVVSISFSLSSAFHRRF